MWSQQYFPQLETGFPIDQISEAQATEGQQCHQTIEQHNNHTNAHC